MALRLPGGLSTPSQLWDFIVSKQDAKSRIPPSRYGISSYHCQTPRPSAVRTEYGYFLDESIDLGAMDTSFFSFTKAELEFIDPQQRLLLEVVRECFDSAGETDYRGKKVGCFVGSFGDDWMENLFHDNQMYDKYSLMIGMDYSLPNRISFEYDLRGPSMSVRTACSSSLVSLHQACAAIQRGECSSAIVAGCNLIMAPTVSIIMSVKGVLSSDGSCKTFDSEANGYGRAEAINAIYIKPLRDALRDGNPIRAVIRGSAVNNDGKTAGFNAPSTVSQEHLIRQTYSAAGIKAFSETAFVECHGTGTAVGDPIEATAIGNIFGDKGVYIGSVKPNVGHSEGASGLTSLIKTVLALEQQMIPPNIKFESPNPKIPFKAKKLEVPTELIPWPQDRCLRASVNCFGLGGTNAHVILESARNLMPPTVSSSMPSSLKEIPHHPPLDKGLDQESDKASDRGNLVSHLLVFSANTTKSLGELVHKYQTYLQRYPSALGDLAYTLGARREHLAFRTASVVDHRLLMAVGPTVKAPMPPPKVVMVFTGQGAQWPGMGADLYKSNSTFRATIAGLEQALQTLSNAPAWSISDEMNKTGKESNLDKASYAQTICTALQIALVDLFRKLGITPYAVIGHSSGEAAAAYAAGKLSAKQALILSFYRGILSEQMTRHGAMVAVGLGKDEVEQFMTTGVVVACENSPSSVTISGDLHHLDKVVEAISVSRPDILVRRLKVNIAYHSHHMKDVGDKYRSLLERLLVDDSCAKPNPSPVRFFSSLRGQELQDDDAVGPRYWQSHLECPVLFYPALKRLINNDNQRLLFVEIGPHSVLSGPIRQTLDQTSRTDEYISSLVRFEKGSESFLSALGKLHCQNITIDFKALHTDGDEKVLTDVPTYSWDHSFSALYEPRENKEWRWPRYPRHELLGCRVIDSTDNEPCWRNVLHLEHVPWLRDHKIRGVVVFPAAGYIAMLGAALGQLVSIARGYHIRNMVFSTALVLSEVQSTEILMSLRRCGGSPWYNFTISSHNGTSWVEHCCGQGRSSSSHGAVFVDVNHLAQEPARTMDVKRWFQSLRRQGLEFGPAFQLVNHLSSSVTHQAASAQVKLANQKSEYYPQHPTTLDCVFQTSLAAAFRGLDWEVDRLVVPTNIGEIEIYDCPTDLRVKTLVRASNKSMILTEGEALGSDGAVAVRFNKAILRSIATSETSNAGQKVHSAARVHWIPDVHFLRLSDLISSPPGWKEHIKLLDDLSGLCVDQALVRTRECGVSSSIPHIEKFQRWLRKQAPSTDETGPCLKTIIAQLTATPAAAPARAIVDVLDNMAALCKGEVEPLEVLMRDETLLKLYDFLNLSDCGAWLQSLGHCQPKQRVLEIGAGTGGTTAQVVGKMAYSTYTFTDISAAFFPAAKERFKKHANLGFKTLDITKDPVSQGFEMASFDLIIAANVLHATPSLHETLVNVATLLAPQGKLLLQELCAVTKFANFIVGILPGWWAGEADGRPDEPYVSPARWEQELKQAGFNGLDDFAYDATPPYHANAYMLASPCIPDGPSTIGEKYASLLCDAASADVAAQVQASLETRGYRVRIHGLAEESLPEGQDAIVLVDTASPFFYNLDAARLSDFQSLVHGLQLSHSGALWVTQSSQLKCEDTRFSTTMGAVRTTRSEFGLEIATCELDVIDSQNIELMLDVFDKFHSRLSGGTAVPELEYAISDGIIYVGRILPFSADQELKSLTQQDSEKECGIVQLEVGTRGLIDSLVWKAAVKPDSLNGEEVEVDMDTAGMSHKDVLMTLGGLDAISESKLGCDGAGIVRRVGSGVGHLSPGDRVFVMGPGSISSTLVTSAALCARIPQSVSLEDAATMPLAFSTVIYALMHVAQLDKGQSILIHSACGGVGLAAIQISQMIGASIYATVGSQEKVEYLAANHGIARNHIFHSRDSSFLAGIMNITDGRGVDVVLNSLHGDLLDASCQCVAQGGRLINLNQDTAAQRQLLPLHLLKPNTSYSAIDVMDHIETKPRHGTRLLQTMARLCEQGLIRPIRPAQTFSAHHVKECFKYMQSRGHIGKLRISLSEKDKPLIPVYNPKALNFPSDASYLLVGGLGGLGAGLARWMVQHGARHFIFLSRSAGHGQVSETLIQELQSQGCSVNMVKGSVCDTSDIKKAIDSAPMPLRGIVNMSLVLSDQSLLKMTLDEWNAATEPRIQGTWNLHHASLDHDLDFFVLFGSMCGIFGMPGQANYAATNTFMDAFTLYRHKHGLVASVLDIGAVEGIGYYAQSPELQQSKMFGYVRMSQRELFDSFTLAVCNGLPRPETRTRRDYVNPAQILASFRNLDDSKPTFSDCRFAAYCGTATSTTTRTDEASAKTDKLPRFLAAAAADYDVLAEPQAGEFVGRQIGCAVFDLLMKPLANEGEIDLSRSLSDIGLDSLAAVELRSWWKLTLGMEISVLEITSFGSLRAMGEHAVRELIRKLWPDKVVDEGAVAVNGA